MKLSIVVPCYNESKSISALLSRFDLAIGVRDDIELIIVNNGSTDDTESVLSNFLPKYRFAKMFKVPINQGYGYGILQGLKEADGDYLGWTHADLQTDPHDVIKAWDIIQHLQYPTMIYVKGLRRGRSLFDNIFTVGMSFFESFLMGCRLWDINAQPNVFHRSFFMSWVNPPFDFSLDLYALYKVRKHRLKLIRFPVTFPARLYGHSHWNTGLKAKYKFIQRTIEYSLKLRKQL